MPKSSINRSRGPGLDETLENDRAYVAEPGTAEERLARAVDGFTHRVSRVVEVLEQQSDGAVSSLSMDHRQSEAELRRGLRDVIDQLQEAECERDALWEENERLRSEVTNLRQALSHTHHIHEHCRAMEATRGWRMLNVLRRFRRVILRK